MDVPRTEVPLNTLISKGYHGLVKADDYPLDDSDVTAMQQGDFQDELTGSDLPPVPISLFSLE
jgi:hypothetical protein